MAPKTVSSYEDRQHNIPTMDMPEIERFEFMYPGSATDLRVEIPEFTCLCPKTGQPDFAVLTLDYVADKLCVELKSLKLYIWSFRDEGHFHEDVTNRILDDLVQALYDETAGHIVIKPGVNL